jgi:hypothetical protein
VFRGGLPAIHRFNYVMGLMTHGLAVLRASMKSLLPIASVAALALAGCATPSTEITASCPSTAQKLTAAMVFGRVSPNGPSVSEAEFTRFITREVSPRFPDGLTVVDGRGHWKPPAGSAVHEPSKLVMVVLPGGPDDGAKLDAVRAAYEARYHQQSLLLPTSVGCVSL